MPSRPTWCSLCGGHESKVGRLSARGRCAACGERAMLENTHQITDRTGPFYDRWRAGLARWVREELGAGG